MLYEQAFEPLVIEKMKVAEQQNSQKNKLFQAVKAAMQLPAAAAGGAGEADALLKEFSDVMDKIAAKLKESAPKGKVIGFNDFGIGEMEHLAVMAQKPVEAKERPEAQPQEKKDLSAEKSVQEASPADKSAPVKVNADSKQDQKAGKSDKPVEQRSERTAEGKAELKEEAAPGAKEIRELVKQAVDANISKPAAKVVSEKAAPQAEVPVAGEKVAIPVEAKVAVKVAEVKPSEAPQKIQDSKPVEVKPHSDLKVEEAGKELNVDQAASLEVAPEMAVPKTDLNGVQVQAQTKIAAAFSAELSRIRADISVSRPSAERDISISSVSKHGIESAGKTSDQVNATSARSNPSGSEGSFAKLSENLSRSEAPRAMRPLTQAASTRTMEKVENALKEAAKSRDGKTISLRLDPPDLGTVKVDISVRDGTLHARIVAESPAVNQLLRDKAHDLQSALRKLGLQVDTVSVSVGNYEQGSASNQQTFSQQKMERESTGFVGMFGSVASGPQGRETVSAVEDHWIA